MKHTRSRTPKGTTAGGQFATEAKSEPLVTLSEPRVSDTYADTVSHYTPSWQWQALQSAVEQANLKLRDTDQRFLIEYGFPTVDTDSRGAASIYRPFIVRKPRIFHGGYEFVDVSDRSSQDCGQCGGEVEHTTWYTLVGEGGASSVGASCVQDFTGDPAENLWAMTWDAMERARLPKRPRASAKKDSFSRNHEYPMDDIISIALALENQGVAFVSSSKAQRHYAENRQTLETTAEKIRALMLMSEDDADLGARASTLAQAVSVPHKDVQEVRDYMANAGKGDFALATYLVNRSDLVSNADIGVVAAAAAMRKAPRNDTPASPHIGQVGDIVSGQWSVTGVREMRSKYDNSTTSLVTMADPDGRTVKWFSPRGTQVHAGDTIKVLSAVVKSAGHFNGVAETTVKDVVVEG